ncbi:MAG TPA: hypothetical protein VLJ41_10935 [Segetibacter sp.]|nr:hypothetical protein [Segetibacter sp.]
MKKLQPLFYLGISIAFMSCLHSGNNVSLSYANSRHSYSMKAKFNESKTRNVEEYLDRRIGNKTNMSFVNTRIDGTIALNDESSFYIRKSPGELTIKLDKDANSEEAYERIKAMCEGIKSVITNVE